MNAPELRRYADRFYNDGLRSARAGNMTAAARLLTAALAFDKNFTDARNLLGLVYYNTGRVGDAIREWRLSVMLDANPLNAAIGYETALKRSPREFEKKRDSLHIYNNALAAVRSKSSDLAVIQLKKALESNKNFVEAAALLALCYIEKGQTQRALKYAYRALDVDAGCEKALYYLRVLGDVKGGGGGGGGGGDIRVRDEDDAKTSVSINSKPFSLDGEKPKIWKMIIPNVICLGIGAALALAYGYNAQMKPALEVKNDDFEEQQAAFEGVLEGERAEHALALAAKDEAILALDLENEGLFAEIGALRGEIDTQKRLNQMEVARTYYAQGKYEETLAFFATMDKTGFPEDVLGAIDGMTRTCKAQIAQAAFTRARELYNAGAYDECRVLFEKAVEYADDGASFLGDAYYFTGRVYEIAGDRERAYPYFLKVVEEFPNANNYSYAVTRERNLRPKN